MGIQLYTGKADVEQLGGMDIAIRQLKESIDAFKASTGLDITIIEFSFNSSDEAYKATFLKKFLAMCGEDRAIDGLIYYFWLNEQLPASVLVLKDGSFTPAGRAVFDCKRSLRP